jgi:hypothetical protein
MNDDVIQCPDPEALVTLLYEDEGDGADDAALRAHVQCCARCARTLEELERTRGTLNAWRAPRLPVGFAIVDRRPPLWQRVAPWAGLAAAAVLTLAGAAGVAGLHIRYDATGLTVTTGWGRTAPADGPSAPMPAVAPAAMRAAEAPHESWLTRASEGEPPWRADFDLLATQLRAEFEATTRAAEERLAHAARPVTVAAQGAPFDEDAFMQRVMERIDQSEVRQQQNLALRIAELGREFQLRRQADLVQFERGLARIENQRQDLIRRVAVTQAPQP